MQLLIWPDLAGQKAFEHKLTVMRRSQRRTKTKKVGIDRFARRGMRFVDLRTIPKYNKSTVKMKGGNQKNLVRSQPLQELKNYRAPPVTKARAFTNGTPMVATTPKIGCVRLKGSAYLGTVNWQPLVPQRPDDTKSVTLSYGCVSFRMAQQTTGGLTYGDNVLPVNPLMSNYMPRLLVNQAASYRQFQWLGMRLKFSTRVPTATGGLMTLSYQSDPAGSDSFTDSISTSPINWPDAIIKNSVNSVSFPLYNNFVYNVPVTGKKLFLRSYYTDSQFLPDWLDEALRESWDGIVYFKLEAGSGVTAIDIFDIHIDYDLCLFDPAFVNSGPTKPPVVPTSEALVAELARVPLKQTKFVGTLKTRHDEKETKSEQPQVGEPDDTPDEPKFDPEFKLSASGRERNQFILNDLETLEKKSLRNMTSEELDAHLAAYVDLTQKLYDLSVASEAPHEDETEPGL